MSYFIAIQYPYQELTITLSKNQTIITTKIISKFQAMGMLIPAIQEILKKNNLQLHDISAFAINNGPGPFNTLRSIIAMVNAINFAQKTPLIACNGLELLTQERSENIVVGLLDAFGSDVYYIFKDTKNQGYQTIEQVIATCNQDYFAQSIIFIGNGSTKHKAYILKNFTGTAIIDDTIQFAREQTLINNAYEKFLEKNTVQEIYPLYFESPVVKP